MRSLMVVVPHEILDGSTAGREGKQLTHMQAFIVDRSEEALDLAVGLGRVRPQQVVANVMGRADLLEARQAVRVMGMSHGEGERVVRQHGVDAIRQGAEHMLEKRGRDGTGLLGVNRHDRLAAKVVDGRKFEVIPGISQRMLTLTLRNLERDGLAARTVFAEVPPRVEYELTPLGQTLITPAVALAEWAVEHDPDIETNQATYDRRADGE